MGSRSEAAKKAWITIRAKKAGTMVTEEKPKKTKEVKATKPQKVEKPKKEKKAKTVVTPEDKAVEANEGELDLDALEKEIENAEKSESGPDPLPEGYHRNKHGRLVDKNGKAVKEPK